MKREYCASFRLGHRKGEVTGIYADDINLADRLVRQELMKRYPNCNVSVMGVYVKEQRGN